MRITGWSTYSQCHHPTKKARREGKSGHILQGNTALGFTLYFLRFTPASSLYIRRVHPSWVCFFYQVKNKPLSVITTDSSSSRGLSAAIYLIKTTDIPGIAPSHGQRTGRTCGHKFYTSPFRSWRLWSRSRAIHLWEHWEHPSLGNWDLTRRWSTTWSPREIHGYKDSHPVFALTGHGQMSCYWGDHWRELCLKQYGASWDEQLRR